jgi:uncharacterized membrane protein YidH (DUF202 family)
MWWRGLLGLVATAVGAVWIGQGTGAVHGSFMTGQGQYTALGIVLVVVGLFLLGWAIALRQRIERIQEP